MTDSLDSPRLDHILLLSFSLSQREDSLIFAPLAFVRRDEENGPT